MMNLFSINEFNNVNIVDKDNREYIESTQILAIRFHGNENDDNMLKTAQTLNMQKTKVFNNRRLIQGDTCLLQ